MKNPQMMKMRFSHMKNACSISVMARITLNLHALNNEETDGNSTLLRNVGIVLPQNSSDDVPQYKKVNAISGQMSKHMFEVAFRRVALDMKLPVNHASETGHPERIWGDPEFQSFAAKAKNLADVYDAVLSCCLTDVCGMMALEKGRQIKRKSLVEFGWMFGLPSVTQFQSHNFTRNQPANLEGADAQMIFNKQIASGIYALTSRINLNGIGYNYLSQNYPDEVSGIQIDRKARMDAVLTALGQFLIQPEGAGTSTQLPQFLNAEGMICLSSVRTPPPLVSPQSDDYISTIEQLINTNRRLFGDESMHIYPFTSAVELMEQILTIQEEFEPGSITVGAS
jgi:CRISPR-associated protein Cst2